MEEKLLNTVIKVSKRTPAGKAIEGASKLIKLFRGEKAQASTYEGLGVLKKTKGRWFHTSKDYVKYFTGSDKGERILKTVNVSEKDYNIGRKIHDKIKGRKGCEGDLCSMGVILPKKNLKDVKTKKFSSGGSVNDYIKDLL